MTYDTIIDRSIARDHLEDADWTFVDCRFFLAEPDRGMREYADGHLPGAVYAHLDHDLSGPVTPGVTGRHPLPSPEALERTLGSFGIGPTTQVVIYDESTGALAAARLWWLLKWAGHESAAVLDGGLKGWMSQGLPLARGVVCREPAAFVARFRPQMIVGAEEVQAIREDPAWVLLDARSEDRFRGVNETIDLVAGHIPGAISAPYMDSLQPDGSFKPTRDLSERFSRLAGTRDAGHAVFYCGSGVTATHGALAFARSGRGIARVYPGSWSEWITDPSRPVER